MKKLLMTVITFLMFALSVVMVGCSGLKLEAPANVRYDGSTITWNKVEGADLYTIMIGEKEYTVSSNKYPYNANNKEFTVTVKGASKTSKVASAEETILTFIPLAKIETVNVDADGNLSWGAIENATAYEIRIDNGTPFENVETTYTAMPEGAHNVQVRPIVSGDPCYYSAWSEAKSMTKLAQVKKDDVTYSNIDGKLSWKVITGAQYYQIKINGVVVEEKYSGTAYMYDAHDTDFEASVKAIGNGSSTFNGKESDTKSFVFLDTVTEIEVNDGKLQWKAVPGADAYKIKQNGSIRSGDIKECELSDIPANTQLSFQIMPISNDSVFFSNWSAEKNVFLLSAPITVWHDDIEHEGQPMQSITWNAVEGATGYTARVTTPDGEVKHYNYPETQRFYENAYLTTGEYKIEIKATSSSTDKQASKYSDPISVTRLEAPRAADSNYIVSDARDARKGFTVNFQTVSRAIKYNLYREGNLAQTNQANQFNVTSVLDDSIITEQSYTYKIQAVGSDSIKINKTTYATISSLLNDSLSFTIKVLAQPTTPTISGYTYSYGEINGSYGYYVKTGSGQPYLAGNTSYDLSNLEAGTFPVSVCATGNGAEILSSNYTSPITVVRLEAPTNIKIDSTELSGGSLAWDDVAYASSYVVVFNNDGNAIDAKNIDKLNDKISTQGTTVFMRSVANYFNDQKTIYYMTSKDSLTTQFIKLDIPRVGDTKFNNNQFIWNHPSNINSAEYTPTYKIYDEDQLEYESIANGTSWDTTSLAGGKDHTFYVRAIGNGTKYINSGLTQAISIYKLATPEVQLDKENGKYCWDGVEFATSYAVYVDGEKVHTVNHESGAFVKYEYAPKFETIGSHTVKVIAVGDGNGIETIDSNPYTFTQRVEKLTAPEISVSYSEDNFSVTGCIVVNITKQSYYKDASGAITTATNGNYIYQIAGAVSPETKELTYSHNPNATGEYRVKVYACTGSFDDNGVYYVKSDDSETKVIRLLRTPNPDEISLTQSGSFTWPTVDYAIGYELEFAVNGGEYGEKVRVSEGQKYNFAKDYMKPGDTVTSVRVRIRAIGNGNNVISSTTVESNIWDCNFNKPAN